ncbi:phage tail protein [Corallococcus carmarthensis]|uniref:Phage tail protein n=1 Tax=Corallococcus carmarthensis TaxID=2316728 RepID=A0A3A8JSI7_9BACT|nr:tail fiber protein [Corallococcus carmarthensis]NOK17683.1 phage tail protein [Corallococcus carmarthensis]RKG93421.1 phage tail protein [Corallococcus carmarthensis]
MSEPYIGQIIMFGGDFAPRGWLLCNGALLPIAQNQALFAILGTTYGGNGTTTFALPDLRGRFPMQPGQGPGLAPHTLGEVSGQQAVTLISPQMPAHTHPLMASNQEGNTESPEGAYLAAYPPGTTPTPYVTNPSTVMGPQAVGIAGGSQPVPIMNPYTCVNFIIATEGVFPSRG